MKLSTLITTATVTLALVVPGAANAGALAGGLSLHRTVPSKPVVVKKKIGHPMVANKKSKPKLTWVTPSYIVDWRLAPVSTSTGQAANRGDLELCTDYMVNCTAEQDCAIWGANCNSVPAPASTSLPAADSTSNDESAAVAPSEETAVADSSNSSENSSSAESVYLDGSYDDCGY